VNVLRQLPFKSIPSTLQVAAESVTIRPFQIIVWMSLGEDPKGSTFPVVVDTGHNQHFSIQEIQLLRWAGVASRELSISGRILVNRQEVPLCRTKLWLHRNRPGTMEILPEPFELKIEEGIAVYPESAVNPPRLPLLGLRALAANRLRLEINGADMTVMLRSLPVKHR
jgi:hypothetical protein